MRRLLLLAPVVVAGCLSDGDGGGLAPKRAEMPPVSEASKHLGARIDLLGNDLVASSIGLGVSPTFAVVGRPGLEISHPDLNGMFVSEGLAARCTDDELAGVLALELARMSVEAKQAKQMVRAEPMRPAPSGAGAQAGGGFDPNQATIQALVDQQAAGRPGHRAAAPPDSTRKIAERLLADAGKSADGLDAAEKLHAEAARAATGPGVIGNRSVPPKWSN